jgi:peptidoglycan lytic transglycosylase
MPQSARAPRALGAFILAAFGLASCTTVADTGGTAPAPPALASEGPAPSAESGTVAQAAEPVARQEGRASFYSDDFQGEKTASGEHFSQHRLTAASPDLPLGAKVTVTNQETGKSVDVKVNDRGPTVDGRVIDLSKSAARRIGIDNKRGVAPVTVEAKPSKQATEELKDAVLEKAGPASPD